jgi:hypothetical protein
MFFNQAIQNEVEKLNQKFYYLYMLVSVVLVPKHTVPVGTIIMYDGMRIKI